MVVRRSRGRLLERIRMHAVFQRLAADHVEIGQSVVVVIEPDAAGAGAFEQRAEFLRAEAVGELNAGLCGGIFEADRAWARLACGACASRQRGQQKKSENRFDHACFDQWFLMLVSSRGVLRGCAGHVGGRGGLQQDHGNRILRRRFPGRRGIPHRRAARRGASRRIRLRASRFFRRHPAVRSATACSVGT